jgi:divinyl protochlorophyllide a 8-vinyl-reductase
MTAAVHAHRIGPNAVIRVGQAIEEALGGQQADRLFGLAGLAAYRAAPPEQMVDEREVTRLHQVLRAELGLPEARRIARTAGRYTGDYLLANRIPSGVQRLLHLLPAGLASRVLLGAIRRNGWTFAGSGELRVEAAFPPTIAIAGCCICKGETAQEPLCDYYAAAFERLFRTLVHARALVTETACQATGSDACRFEMVW